MSLFWSYHAQHQANLFAHTSNNNSFFCSPSTERELKQVRVSVQRAFLANAKESFIGIERGAKEKVLQKALYFYDKYTMQCEKSFLKDEGRKIFFICLLCKFLTSQARILVYMKTCKLFPLHCLAKALEFRMNIVYIFICDKHHEVELKYPRERESLSFSNLIEAFIHFEHTATASHYCWGSENNTTKNFLLFYRKLFNNKALGEEHFEKY